MKFPSTFSNESLSVFVKNELHTIPSNHPGYTRLVAHLNDPSITEHDEQLVLELLDKREMVSRLTAGLVSVVGDSVIYNGETLHSAVTEKLISMLDAGMDAQPWAHFLNNLMENPSERSRDCLYNFMEHHVTPLTPDGHFVAWKYVTDDYKDAHTKTFDNSPGSVVSMPREEVDCDPNNSCSRGLHVCASPYLEGYARSNRIIAVKVNPRDVCAVPAHYDGFSKMRTCRYEVMGDAEGKHDIRTVERQKVVEDQGHAKSGVHEIPEELEGLRIAANAEEFESMWEVNSNPLDNDEFVRKPGQYLVGVVSDFDEGYEDDVEYYDDDLDEYVVEEEGHAYQSFDVIWQNGVKEHFYINTDYDDCSLQNVHYIDTSLIMDIESQDEDGITVTVTSVTLPTVSDDGFIWKGAVPSDASYNLNITGGPVDGKYGEYDVLPCNYKGADGYIAVTGAMSPIAMVEPVQLTKPDTLPVVEGTLEVEVDGEIDQPVPGESFFHKATNQRFSKDHVVREIAKVGQREFSRQTGVPRTTLQEWLKTV